MLKRTLFQDREFIEVDLPFNGIPKKLGSSSPPPDALAPAKPKKKNILTSCCGMSDRCNKVNAECFSAILCMHLKIQIIVLV